MNSKSTPRDLGLSRTISLELLALILGLIVQTGIMFYWGGSISQRISSLERASYDKYTASQAAKDQELIDLKLDQLDARLMRLEENKK